MGHVESGIMPHYSIPNCQLGHLYCNIESFVVHALLVVKNVLVLFIEP